MSDSTLKKKKKSKKSKKEFKVKTPPDSESSDEELDLTKDCHPIAHYISDRPQMVAEMFSVIKGSKLKAMLPPVLKEYDVDKLKLKCLDQLLGMSEKRIISILDGEILDSSSESDAASEESEESQDSQSEGQSSDSSDNSKRKKRKTVKSEPEVVKPPEKQHNLWNPEDPNAVPPQNQGKTLLEILELEMRARAIRALLKNDAPEKAATSQDQPVISAEVDLTEDDYPSVLKKEVPSEQELDFTEKVQRAAKSKKQPQPPITLSNATEANELREQELRNKLINKKKTYRTREQRLENIEPDIPPEPEIEPTVEPASDPDIIPIEVVKKEPMEIILDDPEEGELSSEEDEAAVVVKKETEDVAEPEKAIDRDSVMETSRAQGGERISAMDDGEFLANTDVEIPQTLENDECHEIELVENEEVPSSIQPQVHEEESSASQNALVRNNFDPTGEAQDMGQKSPQNIHNDNDQVETNEVSDEPRPSTGESTSIPEKNAVNVEIMDKGECPTAPTRVTGPEESPANFHQSEVVEITDVSEAATRVTAPKDSPADLEQNEVEIVDLSTNEKSMQDMPTIIQNMTLQDDLQLVAVRKEPTRQRSKSELALELKQIEEQIDRRTQQPLIVDNVFPSTDSISGDLSKVVVVKIGQKGKELQQYVLSSAEPPVYDISDTEEIDDDDEIMIIEDESATDALNASHVENAEETPVDDGSTWRTRWLSKDKVQKVVKSSKICALVRKRLKSKMAALRAQKSTESEPGDDIAAAAVAVVEEPAPVQLPPVIEGSVSEYEQLFGKKVVETEEVVREFLGELLDRVESELTTGSMD